MNFLFWNLSGRPLCDLVSKAAIAYDVDVIILAECTVQVRDFIQAFNQNQSPYYHADGLCTKIVVFTRFSPKIILPVYESARLTIRHLKPPIGKSALLCAIHFQDKYYHDDVSQALESTVLAQTINEQEQIIGHQRTIVVGDLNMNPFDPGVVGASGLHAVMTRQLARKRKRVVAGKQYNFFYNPMWGQFGDTNPGPPGTYYYQSSQQVSHFWHMFDQVLLRPDLLDSFKSDELRIIDRIGGESLLKGNGVPDTNTGSDHLPILFRMEL